MELDVNTNIPDDICDAAERAACAARDLSAFLVLRAAFSADSTNVTFRHGDWLELVELTRRANVNAGYVETRLTFKRSKL